MTSSRSMNLKLFKHSLLLLVFIRLYLEMTWLFIFIFSFRYNATIIIIVSARDLPCPMLCCKNNYLKKINI